MLQLVRGVVSVNLVFVVVGYSALTPFLKGHRAATWTTFAGLALLVGGALIGLVPSGLAVAGVAASLPVYGAVSIALVITGLGARLCSSLNVAAVGRIDLRALDAQLAVLYVAFVAAATRLLWGMSGRRSFFPP